MRMPVEGYDFLEDSVEELFERGSNLDSSEFIIPKDFETTFEYIIQDFNMLKARYEFSEDKVYFHVNDETNDLYAYKKDSKYYIVNEKEKQYYEYGEEAKEAFDNSVKGQKASVASMFASYATVDIDGLITQYAPGVNAEIKYSTKGDGSLIIELSYKGEEAGMKGEMYGKAAWENYYPTELTFKSEASGSGQTMKMEMSAKFEYSVNPSYKDLSSGYTKLN